MVKNLPANAGDIRHEDSIPGSVVCDIANSVFFLLLLFVCFFKMIVHSMGKFGGSFHM